MIYLIRCEGFNLYKIGWSRSGGESRLQTLQTGCPFELTLVDEFKTGRQDLETLLHRTFAANRRRGEWFEFDEPTLRRVREFMRTMGAVGKHIKPPPKPKKERTNRYSPKAQAIGGLLTDPDTRETAFERIREALQSERGNVTHAAIRLQVGRRTLHRWLSEYPSLLATQ